jgi:pyruvate,orthophosphate dikinase
MKRLEALRQKGFGNAENPLLVSVRSGARESMPGAMDTVLNLGLNDKTVVGLATLTNNPRFAYDSYRRFIKGYGEIVLGIEKDPFDSILAKVKERTGASADKDLTVETQKEIIGRYKVVVKSKTGKDFPSAVKEQLYGAIQAVFESWNSDRAKEQRAIERKKGRDIPEDLGTAVNIQSMVFGNMGNTSGTGVGFTRNPSTGEDVFYGEYLINAQGEDVVAGVRTPSPIARLAEELPDAYRQLREITKSLEKGYKDVQDFEFTIENGELWMLQTRSGKRGGIAALRIAVDMVHEGLITKEEALNLIQPDHIEQVLAPVFNADEIKKAKTEERLLTKGLNASPGAATGRIAFTAERAKAMAEEDKKKKPGEREGVVLVRPETDPNDVGGMIVSAGVLTAVGGLTSHAAVVARGMGKPAVVGARELRIDLEAKTLTVNDRVFKEGDFITIDGFTGEVFEGKVETIPSEIIRVMKGQLNSRQSRLYRDFDTVMKWADSVRSLEVKANADTPDDAKLARALGAKGIGLARTEHMFFGEERLPIFRKMILSDSEEERRQALAQLLPYQKEDFKGLLREMKGYGVTIRTLDPPLHEFLPKNEQEAEELSRKIGISANVIMERTKDLHEFNPMLGHRGARLGIVYPEITEMQVWGILSAASELEQEGIHVLPEIMIPLVGNVKELQDQTQIARRVAVEVEKKYGFKVQYKLGTMIEVPRGALTAGEIAEEAEFFSFGTNDLTQMTMGFSRDDSGIFIRAYLEKGILEKDPFESIDEKGVGQLVEMAVQGGRAARPDLILGICGEHGGDPSSIRFFHRAGLDYVSASPYRVPIARLVAAQAQLKNPREASQKSQPKSLTISALWAAGFLISSFAFGSDSILESIFRVWGFAILGEIALYGWTLLAHRDKSDFGGSLPAWMLPLAENVRGRVYHVDRRMSFGPAFLKNALIGREKSWIQRNLGAFGDVFLQHPLDPFWVMGSALVRGVSAMFGGIAEKVRGIGSGGIVGNPLLAGAQLLHAEELNVAAGLGYVQLPSEVKVVSEDRIRQAEQSGIWTSVVAAIIRAALSTVLNVKGPQVVVFDFRGMDPKELIVSESVNAALEAMESIRNAGSPVTYAIVSDVSDVGSQSAQELAMGMGIPPPQIEANDAQGVMRAIRSKPTLTNASITVALTASAEWSRIPGVSVSLWLDIANPDKAVTIGGSMAGAVLARIRDMGPVNGNSMIDNHDGTLTLARVSVRVDVSAQATEALAGERALEC